MKGEKGNPPRFTCYLLLYIFLLLLGFTIYMLRKNEPSSFNNQPPTLYFNEGGEKCFAKNSIWQKIKNSQENIDEAIDIFHLGGLTPKSLLRLQNKELNVVWKPQLPLQDEHHDSSFFEVVYFHLDCLLEVRKTPPAASFNISSITLMESLTEHSKKVYEDRQIDWIEWREGVEIAGVSQYFVEDVKHLNVFVEKFGKYIRRVLDFFHLGKLVIGETDFAEREYAQRDMLDYIAGNWDRVHNRFYVIDPVTKDTVLVYLDHNHLRLNLEERPFQLKLCKFWRHNIDLLKKYRQIGIEHLIRKSLESEEVAPLGLMDRFDNPVKCLDKRTDEFLAHVDQCIEQYGYEYVFGVPHN